MEVSLLARAISFKNMVPSVSSLVYSVGYAGRIEAGTEAGIEAGSMSTSPKYRLSRLMKVEKAVDSNGLGSMTITATPCATLECVDRRQKKGG